MQIVFGCNLANILETSANIFERQIAVIVTTRNRMTFGMKQRRGHAASFQHLQNLFNFEAKLFPQDETFCQCLNKLGLQHVYNELHLGGVADLPHMNDMQSKMCEDLAAQTDIVQRPSHQDGQQPVYSPFPGTPHRGIQKHEVAAFRFLGQIHCNFQGMGAHVHQ